MSASWLAQRASATYSLAWKLIIRPPRDDYDVSDLGSKVFSLGGQRYEREDIQLRNDRGLRLECSHFAPHFDTAGCREPCPCVVFLHGNCSSRLEALHLLPLLLPRGITVFCMDFSGSGRSEGEYISLGYYEEQDLRVATDYLWKSGKVNSIGLWGRSMGAATAVLRAAEDPLLAACVMDSPFASLREVAEELASTGGVTLPSWLVKIALQVVNKEVRSRAGFELRSVAPSAAAPRALAPALFAVAEDDDLVLPHHARDVFRAWGGSDKRLLTFTGGHRGRRPDWFYKEAADLLEHRLIAAAKSGTVARTAVSTPQLPPEMPGKVAAAQPIVEKEDEDEAVELPVALLQSPIGSSGGGKPELATLTGLRRAPEVVAQLAEELVAMGFASDMAEGASRRCRNVEEAVDYALQQSVDALKTLELQQSSTLRSRGHEGHPLPLLTSQPPTPSLSEQLLGLGFLPHEVAEAVRRCSSAEAAVDWLEVHSVV